MGTKTYTVSKHFLSALLYDDYSGLSSEDTALLNDFVEAQSISKGYTNFFVLHPDDFETYFTKCDITRLFSDCVYIDVFLGVKFSGIKEA